MTKTEKYSTEAKLFNQSEDVVWKINGIIPLLYLYLGVNGEDNSLLYIVVY
jgi:hypothetical protein